jgi:LysM repeat protein
MQFTSRVLTVAASAVAPVLLVSACGGGAAGSSSGNITPIGGSSYVTIEPATTTTTTTTLAPPVTTLPPGQTTAATFTYTIQSGDYLSGIAARHEVQMQAICLVNAWSDCLEHLLLPGDVILLPPEAVMPDGSSASNEQETTTGTAPCTHTIEAGENPTLVANKYDVTFDQLQAVNSSTDFRTTFVVGDVLAIPANGTCP